MPNLYLRPLHLPGIEHATVARQTLIANRYATRRV